MPRPLPSAPHQEELAPGLYRRLGFYAPFVWAALWVIRWSRKAGMAPQVISKPMIPIRGLHRPMLARKLRRAQACGLRRVRRHRLKRKIHDTSDDVPRDYIYLYYVKTMDKSLTVNQFMERFIRDTPISRVKCYGLDAAHNIAAFIAELPNRIAGLLGNTFGETPLNLAAPADPAPP